MDYFFAINQMGGKFAGPFKTYDEAAAAASSAPKEQRPTSVGKMVFCPDVNGAPCPECLRISNLAMTNTAATVEAMKNVAPQDLHQ